MAQHGYLREYDEGLDRDREEDQCDRNFMIDDRDRERDEGTDEWFGGRAQGEHRMSRYGRQQRSGSFRSDTARGRLSFSSHPDDHYRSWRDRQIETLDRDYADYCREREQQFHQEFDSWRQNRQPTQGRQQGEDSDELMLSQSASTATNEPAEGAATLGTNNSENSNTGRRRR